ncbi:MAG: L-arabinose ABC transporter ATP-binding protein AraG [Firmicutes bacterium]|nr:L-arabinose ABC transporter ATP-binding protein AraG [Bacillota bacterium]
MQEVFLEFDSIYKSFPGVQALSDVSFEVTEGSIHALIGENGAGKSTLLKILSGLYTPDAGHISLGGRHHVFHSTSDAIQAGVAIIYQELNLVPELTVAENLCLGHYPNRRGVIDKKQMNALAASQLAELDADIDPTAKVSSLSIAQQQVLEIAKALSRDAKVIAFDEPTSSLSDREVSKLFDVMRGLKSQGRVIIYVSHRLQEVFEVCDSVTILRDGRVVETFVDMEEVSQDTLVRNMVGRSIGDIYNYSPRRHRGPALEVKDLMGPGLVEPVSLSVAKGEVVGIFGLVGAGRTELMKLIYGATPSNAGHIKVAGEVVTARNPNASIHHGVVFCPEDRKKEGIIPILSVEENINLSARRNMARLGIVNERAERTNAAEFVERLSIRTPSLEQLIVHLSGGNQQKAILARWLSEDVKVILFDEPTRGIDVGAKSEIYNLIGELAEDGIGVLIASSELPEVLGISDRILVMREGSLVGSLARDEANEEKLLRLALPVAN